MKLKLFFLSIIALLSIVAYQKYSEYSALKSIDSYESCATAKGSLIQESYPATCVTKLGSHFTQQLVNVQPKNIIPPDTTDWTTYTDQYFSIKSPDSVSATNYSLNKLSEEAHTDIYDGFMQYNVGTIPPSILSSAKLFSKEIEITIFVFKNDSHLSINQWYEKYDNYPMSFGSSPRDPTDAPNVTTSVNEYVAYLSTHSGMNYEETYLIPIKNKMIYINTIPGEQKTLIKQILSTFYFLD